MAGTATLVVFQQKLGAGVSFGRSVWLRLGMEWSQLLLAEGWGVCVVVLLSHLSEYLLSLFLYPTMVVSVHPS